MRRLPVAVIHPSRWRAGVALLAAVLAVLAGCGRAGLEPGVAAKVNGAPIAVADLARGHDLGHYGAELGSGQAGAKLREEYGEVLAGLVVQKLVVQELARRGLDVNEAELLQAEMAVRASYPGRAFEDTLADEGLDMAFWRRRLKAGLAREKFVARVLRPAVSVSAEEVQDYFKANAREFAQPSMVRFLVLEAANRDSLTKALAQSRQAAAPEDLLTVFDDVSVQTLASPEEKLSAPWRQLLTGLAPGQASRIVQGGPGFQALLLLERNEPRAEGAVQAYPLVEKRLVEKKLDAAFARWLDDVLAKAVIEVNPALAPEKR